MREDPVAGRAAGRPLVDDDAPIRVLVHEGLVVIRPGGPVDPDTTAALTDALNAAVAAESVAVLDLDGDGGAAGLPWCLDPDPGLTRADRPAPAEAAEPGCIRLATASAWWIVDWSQRRLVCTARPPLRRAGRRLRWTGVCRLWVSATTVTALTTTGSFISARR